MEGGRARQEAKDPFGGEKKELVSTLCPRVLLTLGGSGWPTLVILTPLDGVTVLRVRRQQMEACQPVGDRLSRPTRKVKIKIKTAFVWFLLARHLARG